MSEILPVRTYLFVWVILLVLLVATVAVSYVNMSWFNPAIALGIAITKATIIVLYFMHVRYSPRLVWIFVSGSLLWLLVLFGTFADYLTRPYLPEPTVWEETDQQ